VPGSKLTTMREAIARFIPDGTSVCLNTGIEALIPFATGHELIHQQRRDLTLIGPISDILFFTRYHEETRTVEGNRAWLERWVFAVDDWRGFLDRVGPEVLEQVRIRQHLLSEPLDYGA
jgi:hypothetical protein